jgi:hypothetical protein
MESCVGGWLCSSAGGPLLAAEARVLGDELCATSADVGLNPSVRLMDSTQWKRVGSSRSRQASHGRIKGW